MFNASNDRAQFSVWLDTELGILSDVALCHDAQAIKKKLQEIVPEYTPQDAGSVLK
jgi:hypothetical protein